MMVRATLYLGRGGLATRVLGAGSGTPADLPALDASQADVGSSWLQALFRIIEPASGTIYIDGLDITDMGLHDLRSRLALVPQVPCLRTARVWSGGAVGFRRCPQPA